MKNILEPVVSVRGLDIGYKDSIIMNDLNFSVSKGDIFVIMGVSGSGKTTLLKTIIGLIEPIKGEVLYSGKDFWAEDDIGRQAIMRRFGVLYQGGALWSSLTLGENIAFVLQLHSSLSVKQIRELVALKLSLVGLGGCEDL